MKTGALLIIAGLALGALRAGAVASLEIHEWGTFTVVAGSDGSAQRWYQSESSVAELPKFVRGERVGGKAGAFDFVRMETPVLYFYSDQRTPVSVIARFVNGRITERFPPNAAPDKKTGDAAVDEKADDARLLRALKQAMNAPGDLKMALMSAFQSPSDLPMTWTGELLPPDDLVAAGKIPSLAGHSGAHYGHAREVPAAWYFHATSTEPFVGAGVESVAAEPWEKFIFYRGAGESLPPFSASAADEDSVQLQRSDVDKTPAVAFALNVQGKQARWTKLPGLTGTGYINPKFDSKGVMQQPYGYPNVTAKFSGPLKPQEQAEAELAVAMTAALTDAGLSQDEAKAMVATWRDVWFRETGTRIFAFMPRAWVDSVLPLDIAPKPQSLKRIFVARFEVITPAREQALVALLDRDFHDKPDAKTVAEFRALDFGRFAAGAVERAQELQARRASLRGQLLLYAPPAGSI